MNGAEALWRTLVDAGVELCFTNPGTTEMDMVRALDSLDGLRAVLCLFEGIATGAADGYGRIAGKPAVSLLHVAPGLTNGLANLHNARRARTPLINIVGDSMVTMVLGGIERVSQTLPPITDPAPISVSPPRIEALE